MYETSTQIRTRDAIRAAHKERSRVFHEGLAIIFGRRTKRTER